MKELITEEQANLIVLLLSIAVTLASIGFAFFQGPKTPKNKKRLLWINAILFALLGPVIWVFWEVYNSIENYYGLDSLKAIKINFFIVVGIAVVFCVLFSFVPKWLERSPAARKRG